MDAERNHQDVRRERTGHALLGADRGAPPAQLRGQGGRADQDSRWREVPDRIDRPDSGFVARTRCRRASRRFSRGCVIWVRAGGSEASRITSSSTMWWRGQVCRHEAQHGFIVPADFPVNPPTGIHIAALIHPVQGGGTHPREACTASRRRRSAGSWEASGNTGRDRPQTGPQARRPSPPI